ncbi:MULTISPECIES: hypothetical protein [Bacillota]|uniref:hypothetical protein n=1 Tax=Bacillota TaxID=1239 RepID=UPI0012B9FBE5|nr:MULTISPECIES: hypothetical protein [Bacillota]MTH08268.1 hypothetical protein [Turicibacter sanguinis]MCU7192788.1 hypothetical protein [Turicibacter sp. T129]MCU7206773.1 hypothetical protein [Turicibacter sp. GALT-G1]MTH11092.1 hypothetical protein [Turicibacter sanguinis]MTH13859.1 hypothetical protein [Turicibacter sanguinis]
MNKYKLDNFNITSKQKVELNCLTNLSLLLNNDINTKVLMQVLDNSNSSQMPLVISTANKNCGLIESKLKDNDLQYFIFF